MSLRDLVVADVVIGAALFVLAWATQNDEHGVGGMAGSIGWFGFLLCALILVLLGLVRLVRLARRPAAALDARVGRSPLLHARIGAVPLALRYVVADVFTDTPLTGNQLAVFTDGRGLDDATMQDLAREMNLSESVFVLPAEATGHARIRIFTPVAELPFAGHPTLGSAFVLARPLQLAEIRLETGSGIVPVRLEREGARITFGWMTQPIPHWRPYERAGEVLRILGVESELPVDWYDLGPSFVYVALRTVEEVAALRPDFQALMDFESGVDCFAPFDGDVRRWKTRMFAPSSGVYEDPATGSAAGPLAVHLLRHGRIESGREIEIEQGAEVRRPSRLYACATGTAAEIERVEVGGSAVVVARGEFRLP